VNKLARDVSIAKKAAPERKADASNDLKLVKRSRKGDDEAFSELIARYQGRIYSIALGMTKNEEDAMDITQDAFVKVHRYFKNFQGNSSFYTWIYRIVVNLCIDHIRRDGRRANTDFDEKIDYSGEVQEGFDTFPRRSDANPSKAVSRRELAERIQAAVSELPEYHRAVIIMREIEGFSYDEMANAMKVSKGTIMSRLHHARQKLKKSLEPYLDGEYFLQE
jgi:RNA polymerase sigma-70 factor (ECF subfamily)